MGRDLCGSNCPNFPSSPLHISSTVSLIPGHFFRKENIPAPYREVAKSYKIQPANVCRREKSIGGLWILKGIKNHFSSGCSLNFKWSKFRISMDPCWGHWTVGKLREWGPVDCLPFHRQEWKCSVCSHSLTTLALCLYPGKPDWNVYSTTSFRETWKNKQDDLHHFHSNVT